MRVVTASDIDAVLTFPDLIEALRQAFRQEVVTPVRHHHTIGLAGEPDATLLLMPAWHDMASASGVARFAGVKVVSVYPSNAARGKASVNGVYLLMDGATGEPLAVMDGRSLTLWRTAAASALAASFLARDDASRLVMVGAGALAPYLIAAHASVRPIADVLIWNHRPGRASKLAAGLAGRDYAVRAVADLETAVRSADIVSCATLSDTPLVRGAWLQAGSHVDLVGAFTPAMRESDDDAVRRSRLFADTRGGALSEAGDLVQPLLAGIIAASDIQADLTELCRGTESGRRSAGEITLFKSVGAALEDLAAATLVLAKL